MKKVLFFGLIILLLALIGIGIFVFTRSTTSTATTTGSASTKVPTQTGTTIQTQDFLHNGVTIQDPANTGTYYLAGNSGACKADRTCPTAGTETDFTILYYPASGSFNIGLATEPLGQVRLEAEQYLMQKLGITEAQMCNLKYYIGTTTYVNQEYGGQNLGFSFCPGAVKLPS